ncbi:9497_t:CDS:1, partial [Acaulospora morrowiae]
MGNLVSKPNVRKGKNKETSKEQNAVDKSTKNFTYADGLRYHNVKDARYPLPNDENELDRLHLQHFMMRY